MTRMWTVIAMAAAVALSPGTAVAQTPAQGSVTGTAERPGPSEGPAFPNPIALQTFEVTGTIPGGAATGRILDGCRGCARGGYGPHATVTCLNVIGHRAIIGVMSVGGDYFEGRGLPGVIVVEDNGPAAPDGRLVDRTGTWWDRSILNVPPPPWEGEPITDCRPELADKVVLREPDGWFGDFVVTAPAAATTTTAVDAPVGGTVPATLSLALDAAAPSFPDFVPGTAREYAATATAAVVSSAGQATLSVSDPAAQAPGHLVNGPWALRSPLRVQDVALPESDAPVAIREYDAPTATQGQTITFRQSIAADEPLRTGRYGKALTFTLSTRTP